MAQCPPRMRVIARCWRNRARVFAVRIVGATCVCELDAPICKFDTHYFAAVSFTSVVRSTRAPAIGCCAITEPGATGGLGGASAAPTGARARPQMSVSPISIQRCARIAAPSQRGDRSDRASRSHRAQHHRWHGHKKVHAGLCNALCVSGWILCQHGAIGAPP